VYKYTIVISEDAIREILQLNDAEGVVCLLNDDIFAGLAQMGQRFNFSRYIFDSLVRNVDSSSKFYMYPRVIQLIIEAQVIDLSSHTTRYIFLALTQKVFANMRRVGKENVIEEIANDVAPPTSPLPSSPIVPPSPPHQSPRASPSQAAEARVKKLERLNKVKSSKIRRLKKAGISQRIESSEDEENVFNQGRMGVDIDEGIELVDDQENDDQEKNVQVKGRQADTQEEIDNIDLDHTSKVLSTQEDSKVQEVVEVVNAAKLITEVVTAATTQVILAAKPVVAAVSTPITETQFAKDKGKGILVEDPKPMKKKDQIAMDAEYARKLQEEEESLAQTKDAQATNVQPKDALAKRIQYIRRYHGYMKKP
nr:hypothetical protein [Tanacetum cinerariifolium]